MSYLSKKELDLINKYWMATNYLSACQLYLWDNVLLRKKLSLKDIKCICGEEKTSSILQKNVYGWFERVKKGFYKLSKEGREFLLSNEYEEVKKYYIEQIKKGVFN